MTDVVAFSCKYFILHSGYEESLFDSRSSNLLQGLSIRKELIPIGIIHGCSENFHISYIREGTINANPNQDDIFELNNINERLLRNELWKSCVIFKIQPLQNAIVVFTYIQNVVCIARDTLLDQEKQSFPRCDVKRRVPDIPDIKFLYNEENIIDLVFINTTIKSGYHRKYS